MFYITFWVYQMQVVKPKTLIKLLVKNKIGSSNVQTQVIL